MKTIRSFFVALVLFMSVQAHASDIWGTLSQSNRNARIVSQAQYEVGLLAGQCKTFAIEVVRIASNQANGLYGTYSDAYTRWLPVTADWVSYHDYSSYYWSNSDSNYQYVTATAGNGTSTLSGAVPGSIIQMRIRLASGGYTPHTAIVEVNNTSTQVLTLIESNYTGDGYVKRRWINYPDFVSALEANYEYTIYQIK